MQVLLVTWKEKIPVDQALELLDFNFPDKNVRKYGVDCLQELRYEMRPTALSIFRDTVELQWLEH